MRVALIYMRVLVCSSRVGTAPSLLVVHVHDMYFGRRLPVHQGNLIPKGPVVGEVCSKTVLVVSVFRTASMLTRQFWNQPAGLGGGAQACEAVLEQEC